MAAASNTSEEFVFGTSPLKLYNGLGDLLPTNITVVGTTFVVVLLTLLYWAAVPKPIPGIPYTKRSRWNPFGDAVDFVKYYQETGEGWRWFGVKAAELKSPVFQVFLAPFSKPLVVVADIQEIVDMASRRTKEFDRAGYVAKWIGILFPRGTMAMSSHDKFKDQRNIWSSTMTSDFLNSVSAAIIHRHTRSLVELWSTKIRRAEGRPFEVSEDVKQAAFDMIWTSATGDDLSLITKRIRAAAMTPDVADKNNTDEAIIFNKPSDLPEIVSACETLVLRLQSMRGSLWLWAAKTYTQMTPSWKRAWRTKEAVISRLVEESRCRIGESRCALDEVFKRCAQFETKGRSSSSTREMIDETFMYIIGGHETTQETAKWGLKYLTAYQDKQAKLREALLEVWPGANANKLPSHDEIISAKHPYIEASMQEIFRISLTTPAMSRQTMQEVVFLGYRIPAGIDIFGAPSFQSVEDVDDFDVDPTVRSPSSRPRFDAKWKRETKGVYQPERWLDKDGAYNAYAGPMLAFGAGPRACFGQRLARLELRIIIIMLILSFEFRPIPDAYASMRAVEAINRGPQVTYIRPVLRT